MAPNEPLIPEPRAPGPPSLPRSSFASLRSTRSSTLDMSRSSSTTTKHAEKGLLGRLGLKMFARRTLGLSMLAFTVACWTTSNFLASSIFADDTYSKPFFVVYVNTSIFAISLIPMALKFVFEHGIEGTRSAIVETWQDLRHNTRYSKLQGDVPDSSLGEGLLVDDEGSLEEPTTSTGDRLSFRDTAWLSLEFCMLWFAANYFASACLHYTSVASVTIFTSLSSFFTLISCALVGIEAFSWRKLIGVCASLAGVALISGLDLSGQSDENRGKFPEKSQTQVLIGDGMALFSAIIYGIYVTVMKTRVGNEDRINMPLFFGLIGILNLILWWPGFIILHLTGVETFELPPSRAVWGVIWLNSFSSFISDISWAYAMLLTTPLVVTVGLSLTIPASLIVEMLWYKQYSSWQYWVGACIVLSSFVFINHESHEDEPVARQPSDATEMYPASET